jgi:hypothetical protein
MMSINEELEVAETAKTAINALLSAAPRSAVAATLRKANTAVLLSFSGGETALNEARKNVGTALSDLFHGPLKQQKIEKAKAAVDEWINQLDKA